MEHGTCGSHSFFTENAWGHQAVWACVVQASLPENLSKWTRWLTDHGPRDVGSSSVKQHGQVTRTCCAISMPELQHKSRGCKVRSKCSDVFLTLNYLLGLQESVKNTSSLKKKSCSLLAWHRYALCVSAWILGDVSQLSGMRSAIWDLEAATSQSCLRRSCFLAAVTCPYHPIHNITWMFW